MILILHKFHLFYLTKFILIVNDLFSKFYEMINSLNLKVMSYYGNLTSLKTGDIPFKPAGQRDNISF